MHGPSKEAVKMVRWQFLYGENGVVRGGGCGGVADEFLQSLTGRNDGQICLFYVTIYMR